MARPASSRPRPIVSILIHEYVTGGGLAGQDREPSWRVEGAAMRRAAASDFIAAGCRVTTTIDGRDHDDQPSPPSPHPVIPIDEGREREIVLRLAARNDATLIIAPETGGILADRARWLEHAGARSLGSASHAVALAADKRRTASLLRAAGLATPPDRVIDTRDGRGLDPAWFDDWGIARDTPVVIKPIDGAGSLATYRINGPRHAIPPELSDAGPMLVQPCLPGTPLSASFLVAASGRVTLVGVGRQLIQMDQSHKFIYQGGSLPHGSPRLARAAAIAARAVPGLAGWVGIDFLWDGAGAPVILDVNPRLTTSFVGLTRILPPGTLARHWLASCGLRTAPRARVPCLARRVHRRSIPLVFTPDGRPPVPPPPDPGSYRP